jgi:hypothetical protein
MPFPKADLSAAMKNPTVSSVCNGYQCIETSEIWKWAFAPLPSNTSVAWPGYATEAINTVINGQPIVIQPWLGHCQKFLGMDGFPGGFGAEVGIYVNEPRKDPIPDGAGVPVWMKVLLEGAHWFGGAHLWWPKFECMFDISFKVINPITGKVMIEKTEPKPTYWSNLWMQPGEYDRYKKDVDGQVPFPSSYQMVMTVAGKEFGWHGAGPLG